MFYVRHHDDEVTILNAKCPTALIIDRLKKLAASDIKPECGIDLVPVTGMDGSAPVASGSGSGSSSSSKSQSHPLMLHERCEQNGTAIYANTFIVQRGTYALLSSQEDEEGVRVMKPLWRSTTNDESEKLTSVLEARVADERKKLGSKKGRK